MNIQMRGELADIFLDNLSDTTKLHKAVKDFIDAKLFEERERCIALMKPLMGGDLAVDRRVVDSIRSC